MQAPIWHRAYDQGVTSRIPFEDRPVPGFLERSAREFPDATALIFFNRRMTYRELEADVHRCAAVLSALGVERGSKVAIHLPNLPQTVVAFYAVLSLGAAAVMTNPLYVERELEHQWQDAGCSVAFTTDFLFSQRLSHVRSRLPVRHYLVASIPDYRPATWMVRPLVFPLGRRYRPPSDAAGAQVARELREDRDARLRLTEGMYVPPPEEPGLGRLEAALREAVAARQVGPRCATPFGTAAWTRRPATCSSMWHWKLA